MNSGATPLLDGRIVGGFPVNITQVPWQVALLYTNKQICSGSIISNRWVLTAAHCLDGKDPMYFQVLIGTHIKDQGGELHTVQVYWIHQQYNSKRFDYDFGLLELNEELTFNERIQPIQLPKMTDVDPAVGALVLVSGWGNTKNISESERYLRAVEVPMVDQQLCDKAYKNYGDITDRMFCAGYYEEGGKDGSYSICELT